MFKKRIILFGILVFFVSGVYSQNILSKISKNLYKCQVKLEPNEKELKKHFHQIRIKIDSLNLFDSIRSTDTIFFLESFDIDNGIFYGKIWNKNRRIEYTYYRGNFNFNQKDIFSQYTCKLIEEWNIPEIREEERINSTMTSPLRIFGSRITLINGKIRSRSIEFKEFYNLERDRIKY